MFLRRNMSLSPRGSVKPLRTARKGRGRGRAPLGPKAPPRKDPPPAVTVTTLAVRPPGSVQGWNANGVGQRVGARLKGQRAEGSVLAWNRERGESALSGPQRRQLRQAHRDTAGPQSDAQPGHQQLPRPLGGVGRVCA